MKIDEALYQLKQNIKMHEIEGTTSNQNEREKALLDYITNLQEKSNNQAEEINRLYKQREKFMKKYDYLQEEKDKYKNVIDKIKELINNNAFFDTAMPNCMALGQKSTLEIKELLEEVE